MAKKTETAITRPATPAKKEVVSVLTDMGFVKKDADWLGLQVCEGHNNQSNGLVAYLGLGGVLHRIKEDGRYSKVFGDGGFEQFCKEFFGLERKAVLRMRTAFLIASNLRPMGLKFTSERQLRPLIKLLVKYGEGATQSRTYSARALQRFKKELTEVCKLIQERVDHGIKLTGKLVEECVKAHEDMLLEKEAQEVRKELGIEEPPVPVVTSEEDGTFINYS